ncbi:MAG: hypothetical protein JXX28_02840 [Deltaproteobacteria bacterium]|nr:hypothetical protein [Deltaproteobacteria bacterium]
MNPNEGSSPLEFRIRAPEDGLLPTPVGRGWLAQAWLGRLDAGKARSEDRRLRGASLAKGGRVRDLRLSPSMVTAEVIDTEAHQVSIHLDALSDPQWELFEQEVTADISLLGEMLEGTFPRELFERLIAAGLPLVPDLRALSMSCTCSDYVSPCAHQVAVYRLTADALEGDAFVLTTLMGRDRAALLQHIREGWGDRDDCGQAPLPDEVQPTTTVDWTSPAGGPPSLSFSIHHSRRITEGIPDEATDHPILALQRSLVPLYLAGQRAAQALAVEEVGVVTQQSSSQVEYVLQDGERDQRAHKDPVPSVKLPTVEVDEEEAPLEAQPEGGAEDGSDDRPTDTVGDELADIIRRAIDHMAAAPGSSAANLARHLNVDKLVLRRELHALEELGLVYRTGQTRSTRWWLG